MSTPVIIVTGAFGVLGQAVAQTLSRRGARLALIDAMPHTPEAMANEYARQLLLPGVDLSQYAPAERAVVAAATHFGRVDALVNIAGGYQWETIEAGNPATWQSMFTLNLMTALHASQAVLPRLRTQGGGRIVNISAAASAKAGFGMGAYSASKAGVLRMTEALAEETKDMGITVNAVLPSIIDTPANRRAMPEADFSRWVAPAALADVVAFLLSDGARAITGAGLVVNGRV